MPLRPAAAKAESSDSDGVVLVEDDTAASAADDARRSDPRASGTQLRGGRGQPPGTSTGPPPPPLPKTTTTTTTGSVAAASSRVTSLPIIQGPPPGPPPGRRASLQQKAHGGAQQTEGNLGAEGQQVRQRGAVATTGDASSLMVSDAPFPPPTSAHGKRKRSAARRDGMEAPLGVKSLDDLDRYLADFALGPLSSSLLFAIKVGQCLNQLMGRSFWSPARMMRLPLLGS